LAHLVFGRHAKLVIVAVEQIGDGTRQPRDGFLVDPDPSTTRGLALQMVAGHRGAAVAQRRLVRHHAAGAQHLAYRHRFRRSGNRCNGNKQQVDIITISQ